MNYIDLVKNGCHWLPQNPNCYLFMAKNWSFLRDIPGPARRVVGKMSGAQTRRRVLERMMATKWAENMVYHAGWWFGFFFYFPQ